MHYNRWMFIFFMAAICCFSCKQDFQPTFETWVPYDETSLIQDSKDNAPQRLQYKLIQSKVADRNQLINTINSQLEDFSKEQYDSLSPYILNQDISTLQLHVSEGLFSYKELTQWFLYRIGKFESNRDLSLNAMISINPQVVSQAAALDTSSEEKQHPIYGIPIIVKDNINTQNMPTTAGAVALQDNQTLEDAQIVKNIRSYGGLILGKANLSEWANFLCDGCPNGYSAIGGQTLNPYGPRLLDTGGSSSGSAVVVAANYAPVAVGTETSGSILSPSSQQSVVGLKPTVGVLSQDGIVPISSTLDTPGPISKTTEDNSILFSAMYRSKTSGSSSPWQIDTSINLQGVRFGAFKAYTEDSLYQKALIELENLGAEIIEIDPEPMRFDGFLNLLSGDMKNDLKLYLETYASGEISVRSASDVMVFNAEDSTLRIPYGQARFEGIDELELTDEELMGIKEQLLRSGIDYFEKPMQKNDLDAVLSINNYNAGQAAAAKYPAITVPMGYAQNGEPKGLTFIAKPYRETQMYSYVKLYEEASAQRILPELYANK